MDSSDDQSSDGNPSSANIIDDIGDSTKVLNPTQKRKSKKLYERRNIRKLKDTGKLNDATLSALRDEEERVKRLGSFSRDLQDSYEPCAKSPKTELAARESEGSEDDDVVCISKTNVAAPGESTSDDDVIFIQEDDETAQIDFTGETDPEDEYTADSQIIINPSHPAADPDVLLRDNISRTIKPHQVQGIRFMYSNTVENFARMKKSSGFGCILGHSMGLGKTIQVVSFVDALFRYELCKRVLLIVPINTVQNWVNEFSMWAHAETLPFASATPKKKQPTEAVNEEQVINPVRIFEEQVHYERIVHTVATVPGDLINLHDDLVQLGGDTSDLISEPEGQEHLQNLMSFDPDSCHDNVAPPSFPCESSNFDDQSCSQMIDPEETQQVADLLLNSDFSVVEKPRESRCGPDEPIQIKQTPSPTGDETVDVPTPPDAAFTVYRINDSCKVNLDRIEVVSEWYNKGGVLLMGYEMFRLLSQLNTSGLTRKKKVVGTEQELKDKIGDLKAQLLDPGPDIIIADEGHRIKNSDTAISRSLKALKTRRRIVLTGYPLQNNLMEYWCMVDFVRPNYLGNRQEFSNMFERPISNGQCIDSTAKDRKLMKYRSHVLTSLLKGFVLRRSHSVLIKALPKKTEYIILIRMSPVQKELYRSFLYYNPPKLLDEDTQSTNPIKAFSALCKIWNHPDVLHDSIVKLREQQMSSLTASTDLSNSSLDWASRVMETYVPGQINNGPKFVLLLEIIRMSISLGEKVLVFSQSLGTLNHIEAVLSRCNVPGTTDSWKKGTHYFRLDGETISTERGRMITEFNREGSNCWLFLLSTKAGCLGINLVGASRVVIMDVCWNPCHDAQAVCRVFRYGQTKPTFIYRLVANNSMEKRMYDRQVSKQGMSHRIVDELNPQVMLTRNEVENLLDYCEEADVVDDTVSLNTYHDSLLQELCSMYYPMIAKSPFEHESLLVDNDSKLSLAEKREAKEGFQRDQMMSAAAAGSHTAGTVPRPQLGRFDGGRNPAFGKPVANVKPFYRQNQASGAAGIRGDVPAPLNVDFLLVHDVVIPGSNTQSGGDITLKQGERVSLSAVNDEFFLKSAGGSMFRMNAATAGSFLSACSAVPTVQHPRNSPYPAGGGLPPFPGGGYRAGTPPVMQPRPNMPILPAPPSQWEVPSRNTAHANAHPQVIDLSDSD